MNILPFYYKVFTVTYLISIITFSSCQEKKDKITDQGTINRNVIKVGDNVTSILDNYDIEGSNPIILKLIPELREISGIVITDDDRLFGVGDETAQIYELDKNSGAVIKKFFPGELKIMEGDFEDLAYANGNFYLLKKNGNLYEFPEADNEKFTQFKLYESPLKAVNDVEGAVYDPETNSIVLALKGESGTGKKDEKAVYSFSLNDKKLNKDPRFIIPLDDVDDDEFSPSAITRHPKTGSFILISAQGNRIIEITKDGVLAGMKKLPTKIHIQPEGIAFDSSLNLIISNEAKNADPVLIIYKPIK